MGAFSTSMVLSPILGLTNSMADTGRRPVAREKEAGAEAGDARAGKTKDGSGRGPSFTRRLCWSGMVGERGATKSLIGERGDPRGRSRVWLLKAMFPCNPGDLGTAILPTPQSAQYRVYN